MQRDRSNSFPPFLSLSSSSSERSSHFSLLPPPPVSEKDGWRGWRSGRNLQGPPESSSSPARFAGSGEQQPRPEPNLSQSVRLLTLSANLTLKFACKAWINVDLKETVRFSKKILVFFVFWMKLFRNLKIYVDSSVLLCFWKNRKKRKFWIYYLWFYLEILSKNLQERLILILFDDLMLETENEFVILSLACATFLDRSNSSLLSPFFFLLLLCDRCWSSLLLVRNSCLELQRIQFSDEDSPMNLWELMNLLMIFGSDEF